MLISEKTCKAHPLGSAKQSKLRRPGHRATPGRCAATAALPLSFLSKSPEPCLKKKKTLNPSPFHREEKPPRVRPLPLRPSPPPIPNGRKSGRECSPRRPPFRRGGRSLAGSCSRRCSALPTPGSHSKPPPPPSTPAYVRVACFPPSFFNSLPPFLLRF